MADTVFAGLIVYAQTFPAKNEMWASEATSVVRKETWSLINFAPQNTIVEDVVIEKLPSVDAQQLYHMIVRNYFTGDLFFAYATLFFQLFFDKAHFFPIQPDTDVVAVREIWSTTGPADSIRKDYDSAISRNDSPAEYLQRMRNSTWRYVGEFQNNIEISFRNSELSRQMFGFNF